MHLRNSISRSAIHPWTLLAMIALWFSVMGCTGHETVVVRGLVSDCTYSSECPVGTFCSEGCCRIYEGCQSDAECGEGSTCLCDGLCYELQCMYNSDCPGGTFCSEGYCSSAPLPCETSNQCACGEACIGGLCQTGCAEDADCCGDGICMDGSCGQPAKALTCETSMTCPAGSFCNLETQLCEEYCSSNQDCPAGSACKENGLCYAICSADLPCTAENTFCATDGFCKKGQACTADTDCPAGQFCSEAKLCTLPEESESTP